MRLLRSAAVAAALAFPGGASAGMLLGVRAGVAFPGGTASPGTQATDVVALQVPFTLDLGLAFERQAMFGAYVRMGVGALGKPARDACAAAGAACAAFDFAAGGQLQWRLPQGDFEPWVGAGLGYEVLSTDVIRDGAKATLVHMGWEVPISLGVDFRTASRFTVGAYGQLTVGRFERLRVDAAGSSSTGPIADATAHQWIEVGVRAAFDLF